LTKSQIENAIKLKSIEYFAEHSKEASPADLRRFKKEVIDEFNKERSFNIEEIMKVYMANLFSYKHKAKVVDLINISKQAFERDVNEIVTSNADVEQKDKHGNLKEMDGLENAKALFDFTMNDWLGIKTKADEGVLRSMGKKYTTQERAKFDRLIHSQDLLNIQLQSKKITQAQFDILNDEIEKEIEKTGGYIALSKVGDNILKYTQIKGMGFNAIAGTVNLLTG
jgi:hypothetical protein